MPFPNPDTQIKPGEVRNPNGRPARPSARVIQKILEQTPFENLPRTIQKQLIDKFGTKMVNEAMVFSLIETVLAGGKSATGAFNAIYDRSEGRPTQSIEMDVTNGPELSDRELGRRVASVLTGSVVSPQESAEGVLPQQGEITK